MITKTAKTIAITKITGANISKIIKSSSNILTPLSSSTKPQASTPAENRIIISAHPNQVGLYSL